MADRRGDVLLAQGKTDEARGGLPGGLARRWTSRSTTAAWSKPSSPRWAPRPRPPAPPAPGAGRVSASCRAAALAAAAGRAGAGWPAPADKPKPTPLETLDAQDRRPPGLGQQASTACGFPLAPAVRDGSVHRRRPATARVLALRRRQRPRALARAVPARALSRRRRQRRPLRQRWSRATTSWSPSKAAASCGASALPSRVVTRAAGGRRTGLRDGRGPRRAGLRRPRRPPAVDAAAPRRCADAGAGRRAGGLQGHAAGRAGPAPGRRRPAARHACAGRCRWPRRAAPTRSSAWPTWSGPPCASATWSARAPSSRPWAASTPTRGALLWTRNVGGIQAVGGDAELRVRRRRQRPHHRLAHRQRRGGLDQREAALPRPQRRRWSSGRTVVFGDVEGQVHFLSADDRRAAAAPAHRRLAGGRHAGAVGHHAAGGHPQAAGCSPSARTELGR